MADKQNTNEALDQQAGAMPSISKMALAEVDAEFSKLEATTKKLNESVKAALGANQPVAVEDLRQLQKLTQRRSKLIMRRLGLLLQSPSPAVAELLDKLMKVKATA
jgi:DNA replication initiation complex subunit (GINS family)